MSYEFYLDGVQMPIAPGKLKLKIANNNKTVNLINEGDVNILKKAGLTEISFDLLLPNQEYPFAEGSFMPAAYYLELFEELKISREPFAFTVARPIPSGGSLFGTSMLVSMETYEITEDHDEYGLDCGVSVSLKQYRAYGTRNVRIANAKAAAEKKRATAAGNKPSATQYTVKSGDNLITISKKYYNSADAWKDVYNANAKTIGSNPNKIYPGQVLTLPERKAKNGG